MGKSTPTETETVARQIWDSMDANERFGVKFGMFPAAKMKPADEPGRDHHAIVVALMDMTRMVA